MKFPVGDERLPKFSTDVEGLARPSAGDGKFGQPVAHIEGPVRLSADVVKLACFTAGDEEFVELPGDVG